MATTSPLWQHAASPLMNKEKFSQTSRELGIWQSPEDALKRPAWRPSDRIEPAVAGSARNMNVVVIFQESTYNRFLSLFDGTNNTEPMLSKYKDRMELFPNFYSSFAGSINARFATFTGLYPVGDFNAFTSHHVPVKSLFEVLHDNGYSNSMFYSSFFDYTGFRDFLHGRDIEEMYDADTMPGRGKIKSVSWGLREDETLGAITNRIKKYAADKQKFCLTYVPAAPHNPFDGTPKQFVKFPRGEVDDYTGYYLNELLFMDWAVTSIVDQLKDSGLLDNTLIVITGDHGEMLGENHGPIGHGWALTPELGNVPLIILNPGRRGYRVNDALGSQVDMLPTILDMLGIGLPAGQLYQGTSLYSANADPRRTIYLNTFRQYGIIRSGLLYFGNREERTLMEGRAGFYSYTNDGARTIFKTIDGVPAGMTASSTSISEFDRFQMNFLHNYSDYCRLAQEGTGSK
jgi:arylsulfatase A-like enzyme